MAKKRANKAAGKPRRAGGKRAGTPGMPGSPKPVTTGKGAGPKEIGDELVRRFNRGKWHLDDKLWSRDLVCIEGLGMAWSGRKNVDAKNDDWNRQHIVRGGAAEGPFVGATGFAVKFRMEVEVKASHERMVMEEVGVYTVKNGKIVQEEFMYGTFLSASAAAPTMPGA